MRADFCDLTIVCCYNNQHIYERFLKSIAHEENNCNIVGIDNCNGRYSSCAEAYNAAVKAVDTRYVVFSHQDIVFTDADMLGRFVKQLRSIGECDLLGVAGVFNSCKGIHTNIQRNFEGEYSGRIRVSNIEQCDTVDECFFGGHTEMFRRMPFDERTCDGWHLYAADRCLDLKRHGFSVWVSDISLVHPSDGVLNSSFVEGFLRIARKYRHEYSKIRTCCACSGTGRMGRALGWITIEAIRLKRII